MKDFIEKLIKNYHKVKEKEEFTENPFAEEVKKVLPNEIRMFDFIDPHRYKVKGSPGQSQWSEIPWIGIRDSVITKNFQSGIYVVYLLSNDKKTFFLTLNQGCSQLKPPKGVKKEQYLKAIAQKIRQSISAENLSAEDIDLHSKNTLTKLYEAGCIFSKKYELETLPSDEVLKNDLKRMMGIYQNYAELFKGQDILSKDEKAKEKVVPHIFIDDYMQMIFFGAPGTGKSYKIDAPASEGGCDLGNVPQDRKFRTTFHPDYDYAQFVGSYKPTKDGDSITYSFIPQIFAKAYVAAWQKYLENKESPEQVYLVIEEINRGNCAQIFGDIFQLLDRDDNGYSCYEIDADADFAAWLEKEFDKIPAFAGMTTDEKFPKQGKLKLPPNFNILATMNTSDQSLFPMDSAFKRRFDWEYVPINFSGKSAANFKVEVSGKLYSWPGFVNKVNDKILNLTDSEDKQLGEYFILPDKKEKDEDSEKTIISESRFKGKVMFYLWNEICKDEHKHGSFFKVDGKFFTFQDLYKDESKLAAFMEELSKVDEA